MCHRSHPFQGCYSKKGSLYETMFMWTSFIVLLCWNDSQSFYKPFSCTLCISVVKSSGGADNCSADHWSPRKVFHRTSRFTSVFRRVYHRTLSRASWTQSTSLIWFLVCEICCNCHSFLISVSHTLFLKISFYIILITILSGTIFPWGFPITLYMLKRLCSTAYYLHCSLCWFSPLCFVSDFKSYGVSFKGII
jgi:hypothetical protein